MDDRKKYTLVALGIILFVCSIIHFVSNAVTYYYENTIPVEYTSEIIDKRHRVTQTPRYLYTEDGPVLVGWDYHDHYYFDLKNGCTKNVSYSTYNKYNVGDNYTYVVREWIN